MIIIEKFSTIFGQVALILMKSSHSSNGVLNFKWLLGLIFIIVSSLVHVAVLPYTDLYF